MQLILKRVFLSRVAKHGINLDPKLPDYQDLIYPGVVDCTRFWLPPPIVSDLLNFINAALDSASTTGPFYLYRRVWGTWHYGMIDSVRNQIMDRMISPINIPNGFRGALRLEHNEWGDLLTIISAHYVFAWSVNEDLYIIPDSVDCILMVSHHGQLYGSFPNENRLTEFTEAMEVKGFSLPERG
jgi:hypothetical protein